MTRVLIIGICVFLLELSTSILGRSNLPPPDPIRKPGRCPHNTHTIGCIPIPANCLDDNSCPGNQKCCRVGCAPTCVDTEPVDCPPVCPMFCPYGNVLDDDGCAICKCKPESTIKTNMDSALPFRCDFPICAENETVCGCPPIKNTDF